MKEWIKNIRDKRDIRKGWQLCPICKKDTLEVLTDGIHRYQERCSKGCYIYDFDKGKRIK
jgi:hypothetical protein